MIQKRFMRGSAYVDVVIKGREITFITALLNFVPIKIDLDKLDKQKDKIKQMKLDKKLLKELSNLKTEEDMFKDLKKDLPKSGWRAQ